MKIYLKLILTIVGFVSYVLVMGLFMKPTATGDSYRIHGNITFMGLVFYALFLLWVWTYKPNLSKTEAVKDSNSDRMNSPKRVEPVLEKIVNDYGKSLVMNPNNIARPISKLKNTKGEIEQAIKGYIVALRLNNELTDKRYGELSAAYSFLDHFIDDEDANKINAIHQKRLKRIELSDEEEDIYDDFLDIYTSSSDKMEELDNLI